MCVGTLCGACVYGGANQPICDGITIIWNSIYIHITHRASNQLDEESCLFVCSADREIPMLLLTLYFALFTSGNYKPQTIELIQPKAHTKTLRHPRLVARICMRVLCVCCVSIQTSNRPQIWIHICFVYSPYQRVPFTHSAGPVCVCTLQSHRNGNQYSSPTHVQCEAKKILNSIVCGDSAGLCAYAFYLHKLVFVAVESSFPRNCFCSIIRPVLGKAEKLLILLLRSKKNYPQYLCLSRLRQRRAHSTIEHPIQRPAMKRKTSAISNRKTERYSSCQKIN